MSMKIRAILLMAVAGLFASLMVAPAAADTSGVGNFAGTATVGKWFTSACDKDGRAVVTGRGLYAPGTQTSPVSNGADTREENGVWSFQTIGTASGTIQGGAAGTSPFRLRACGQLGPVVDLTPAPGDRMTLLGSGIGGASCGNSKGHHGQGVVEFVAPGTDPADPSNSTVQRVKLYHVGWKSSAGGVLPVTGRYQEYLNDQGDPNGAAKDDKYGVVLAEVVARGGQDCAGLKLPQTNNGNGAQTFNVNGVAEFINNDGEPVLEPKDALAEPKKCKGTGPAATRDGNGKKLHDNKPDPYTCTDEDAGDKTAP